MADLDNLGPEGEETAIRHLTDKGYVIRHHNWRQGHKEIDIVAEKDNMIIFVEVKARKGNYYLHPRDAVTDKKQKMIIYAAETYVNIYNIDKECRFDVITVISDGKTYEVEHIENAFYPTLR